MKTEDRHRGIEAVQRYTLSHALLMNVSDQAEAARAVAQNLDIISGEIEARLAQEEAQAVAAIVAAGGKLIMGDVLVTIVEGDEGPRLRMEPMGAFGVRREAV